MPQERDGWPASAGSRGGRRCFGVRAERGAWGADRKEVWGADRLWIRTNNFRNKFLQAIIERWIANIYNGIVIDFPRGRVQGFFDDSLGRFQHRQHLRRLDPKLASDSFYRRQTQVVPVTECEVEQVVNRVLTLRAQERGKFSHGFSRDPSNYEGRAKGTGYEGRGWGAWAVGLVVHTWKILQLIIIYFVCLCYYLNYYIICCCCCKYK